MTFQPPEFTAGAARINGRSEFTSAVRFALSQAAQGRARELCFVDPAFEAWPLEDPQILSALTSTIPSSILLIRSR